MKDFDALVDALDSGKLEKIAEITAHMSLEAEDEIGWTPLFYTVAQGDIRAVRMLLNAGANPRHLDRNGWTAAMMAAVEGKKRIAQAIEDAAH